MKYIVPLPLLTALTVRLAIGLIFPQTFFQPDEFFQALEPAHKLAFGYGHLTWEWRDLPQGVADKESLWRDVLIGGRMRSWVWPGIYAVVYKVIQQVGLEEQLLTIAPRVVGFIVASLTDYATYLLGIKFLGQGAGAASLFLSLTSLFNAYVLPRSLSTSGETLLTTLALLYFPFPEPTNPSAISVGKAHIVASASMRNVTEAAAEKTKEKSKVKKNGKSGTPNPHVSRTGQVLELDDASELNYVMMDRMGQYVEKQEEISSNLILAALFAGLAVCIRPTMIPLWGYVGLEHLFRVGKIEGILYALDDAFIGTVSGFSALTASTALDYLITGRLYFPILTFVHYNILNPVSGFYGSTNPLYHVTQSLPILLFPIWYWFAQGFLSCLVPSSFLPTRLLHLDRPAGLKSLSRAVTFSIVMLSFSPHSEWRFLHPLLPSLLLFALPPLFKAYTPNMWGLHYIAISINNYTRISKSSFWFILATPMLPLIYLGLHGKAQVEVINVLRRGELGQVTKVVELMPCHSTPWMSHLHRDLPGWFLTCEPPIGVDPKDHITQQQMFYSSPVEYVRAVFPYPPNPLHKVFSSSEDDLMPSHVLLFGSLLQQSDGNMTVQDALEEKGYREAWNGWNGFDWAQDENARTGGVRVWTVS